MTYLKGILYPHTVNIPGINNHLAAGKLTSKEIIERIEKQAEGFIKFVEKVNPGR